MTQLRLNLVLNAVDHLTAPLRALNERLLAMQSPVRRLGQALNQSLQLTGITRIHSGLMSIGQEVGALTFKLTALATGIGYAIKRSFIDTTAEFEKYETVLITFYGTSEKAKGAMDWVSQFAAKTPYELDETTQAFIELKSFGLDPTAGALKAAGDAAAGMGKPFGMATNTLASAMRGQAEMLDNFGIFGRIEKDKMIMDWVDNAGKDHRRVLEKTDRKGIAAAITDIWNKKYGGSMDRLSSTFTGIVSNIEDNFTRLEVKVMNSGGGFEKLKAKLQAVLDKLNYFQTPEGLKELDVYSLKLANGIDWLSDKLGVAWTKINEFKDAVGGWGNLAKLVFGGVAAIVAGPLLVAITSLAAGLSMLVLAFAANPILLAIVAIGAAIALVVKNWDALKAGFQSGIESIVRWLKDGLILTIQAVVDGIGGIADAIVRIMHLQNPFSVDPNQMPDQQPAAPGRPNLPPLAKPAPLVIKPGFMTPMAAPQAADGKITLEIVSPVPTKVRSMQANTGEINVINTRAGAHFQ